MANSTALDRWDCTVSLREVPEAALFGGESEVELLIVLTEETTFPAAVFAGVTLVLEAPPVRLDRLGEEVVRTVPLLVMTI